MFVTIVVALLMTQCRNHRGEVSLLQYDETGRQLLTLNELAENGGQWDKPAVIKNGPDSVTIGDEFRAAIYLQDKNLKIVEAYFDCDSIANASVDTLSFDVNGCSKKLFVQNDTVLIGFRPTKEGITEFPRITLLIVDHNRIFRTLNYTFAYNVVKP